MGKLEFTINDSYSVGEFKCKIICLMRVGLDKNMIIGYIFQRDKGRAEGMAQKVGYLTG